ncbi:MAG: helix-turn-helix domain-containing protein [Chloroflexota bacterium]
MGPNLPERLFAARERKGVDLYRAERDTKIRARYLAALERGDYKELPGAVYTKGFLRNYALYLGLDPDDVLLQWRRERGESREPGPVIVVPRPIATPRKSLTFSPVVFIAALLTVLIIAFGAYVGAQLLRFAKPPTIAVTQPATAVVEVDESTTTYLLKGTSSSGATVSIATPGREPYNVSADPDGNWSAQVDVRRGRNQFEISAVDPETTKRAERTAQVFITVPFAVIEAPTLTLDQPAEGATFENGAIPVHGTTTNAKSVVVTAAFTGPAPGAPTGAGAPPPPATPGAVTVPVADDGTYQTPFELTAGKWSLTATASSSEGKTAALSRNVTVVYKGVNLTLSIKGGRAWVKVWVDGRIDDRLGPAGSVLSAGKTLTFTGKDTIEVRTGSSGQTYFTQNGTSLGALGKSGTPETWLFKPPDVPVKTQRR